jgi:hypothetical protein
MSSDQIHVVFTDATHSAVLTYFSCQQDAPNSGVVDRMDDRWRVFYENLPELSRAGVPEPFSD